LLLLPPLAAHLMARWCEGVVPTIGVVAHGGPTRMAAVAGADVVVEGCSCFRRLRGDSMAGDELTVVRRNGRE